jgi:hypothetical protein
MTTFGTDYLDKEAADQLAKHIAKKTEVEEQRKISFERQQKEALFNTKAEAFDMPTVKNSKNREAKNKIRRASTIMEVMVYTAMLHMLDANTVVENVSANTSDNN